MLENIDNKLKKSIEQQNIPWDKEAMWLDIEQQLPKKSNRRYVLWLLLFAFITALTIGYYYTSIQTTSNGEHMAAQIPSIPVEKNVKLPVIESKKSANTINATEHLTYNTGSIESNTHTPEDIINSDYSYKSPLLNNNLNSSQKEKHSSNLKKSIINDKIANTDMRYHVPQLVLIQPTTLHLLSKTQSKPLLILKPEINSKVITVHKPINAWSFSLGSAIFNKKYELIDDWTSSLDEAYTPIVAMNMSMLYHRNILPKWSVISGIEIQHRAEKIEYTAKSIQNQIVEVDTAFFFIDSNEKTFIPGSQSQITTDSTYVKAYNTNWSIGIPFYINYSIWNGRSSFSVLGGPIAQLSIRDTGYQIENSHSIIDTDNMTSNSSSWTFSLDLSLSYQYTINAKTKLTIRPYIRRQLHHSIDASSFTFKRNYFGLNAGIQSVF